MLKNYIRTAFNSFRKNKLTALISVGGLAIGMACCTLIIIYIRYELSYNQFNTRISQIYRINWTDKSSGNVIAYTSSPIIFSDSLASKIAGIRSVTRLYQRSGEFMPDDGKGTIIQERRFQESGVYFTDAHFFSIFSTTFLEGGKNEALNRVNSVVITDEMAKKYFGVEDPIGKSLLYENKIPLKITGIVKKMPLNSDIKFDFLISFETLFNVETKGFSDFLRKNWTYNPCDTWVLLEPGVKPLLVQHALTEHLEKDGDPRNRQLNTVQLQPLLDVHLRASNIVGNPSNSNIMYVYIFSAVALLILLIVNVNFVNLSVARSLDRVKEIGVRKVLGAGKGQLAIQFLSETLIVTFLAYIIALLLTVLGIPLLNELTGEQITTSDWVTGFNLFLFLGLFVGIGILAGLYPAFFITRFNMAMAVKGKSGEAGKKSLVQRVLLIVQFTISVTLVIGAIVMYRQLQYLRNMPLGFQKNQMIVVPLFGSGAGSIGLHLDSDKLTRIDAFMNKIGSFHKVKAVTVASEMPGGQGYVPGLVVPQGRSESDNIFFPWLSADYNFLRAMGVKLVAGRDFAKGRGGENLHAFILNEEAVRFLGWGSPEKAIGKILVRGDINHGKRGEVIGVIKNYNFSSLETPVQPLVIDVNPQRFTQFAINIEADHVEETIQFIKNTWNNIFPERAFEYSFLDKTLDEQYKDRENFSKVIEYFAIAAIALSCSGLFSLAFFLALKRTKEIGIRKVLGAGLLNIVFLLSLDFVKLVLLSSILSFPIAWLLMHYWLQSFAFHVNIDWWIFLLSAFLAVIVAFITISFQTIKAATTSPVKTFRTE